MKLVQNLNFTAEFSQCMVYGVVSSLGSLGATTIVVVSMFGYSR